MTQTQDEIKKDQNINKTRTFILYYHFKHAAPLTLVFEFNGNIIEAKQRGFDHCKRMNYRFIKVRPFIVDLDEREKRRNEEGFFEGDEL